MFVVIYQPSEAMMRVILDEDGVCGVGEWRVDTADDGSVATYDDLETALDRVKYIRDNGGEACLSVIIE